MATKIENNIAQIWLSLLRFGQQLSLKAMDKALTEDEAMAYFAICRFAKIKADVDAYLLGRQLEDERSGETEGGGS